MANSEIETSDCLDYVRYTCGFENHRDMLLPAGIPGCSRTGEILMHGSYGYDRTMPLTGGGRIMYHSEDAAMKYCVELSGMALEDVRRDGFEVESIIEHTFSGVVKRCAWARLDYAIDVKNSGGSIEELSNSWETGDTTTLAKQSMFIRKSKSEFKADTVYFGSRESSPRFIRAYDKGAQSSIMGVSWLRLELESKKRRVNGFAESVLKNGRTAAGKRELSDAIKTRVAWVVAALTGERAPRVEVARPEAKPNEFVRNMIIPFIKNHHGDLTDETKKLLLMTIEDCISVV